MVVFLSIFNEPATQPAASRTLRGQSLSTNTSHIMRIEYTVSIPRATAAAPILDNAQKDRFGQQCHASKNTASKNTVSKNTVSREYSIERIQYRENTVSRELEGERLRDRCEPRLRWVHAVLGPGCGGPMLRRAGSAINQGFREPMPRGSIRETFQAAF